MFVVGSSWGFIQYICKARSSGQPSWATAPGLAFLPPQNRERAQGLACSTHMSFPQGQVPLHPATVTCTPPPTVDRVLGHSRARVRPLVLPCRPGGAEAGPGAPVEELQPLTLALGACRRPPTGPEQRSRGRVAASPTPVQGLHLGPGADVTPVLAVAGGPGHADEAPSPQRRRLALSLTTVPP